MDYSDHSFDKIKFKNADDDVPELTLEYTALGSDDTAKEAKDTFQQLPHRAFRDAWGKLVRYWKDHIEAVIGDVDWRLHGARVTTLRLGMTGGMISEVRYWVSCEAGQGTTVTIATPDAIPMEEERAAVRRVWEEAVKFLEGARDQGSLFEGDGIPDELPHDPDEQNAT